MSSLTVLLILVAGVLALVAPFAFSHAPQLGRRLRLDVERRLTAFAAGAAILFGLVIAHFVS